MARRVRLVAAGTAVTLPRGVKAGAVAFAGKVAVFLR
jgi:hypothetical protein